MHVRPASTALRALLPPGTAAYEVALERLDLPAGDRRAHEHHAGRAAAATALAELDRPTHVGRDDDRRPVWPPGVVGSITHCAHLAVAVAAHTADLRAIGVDVADLGDAHEDVASVVLTSAEQRSVGAAPELLAVVAGAKESAYKCWSPLLGLTLEWTDIEVSLDRHLGAFTATVPGHPQAPRVPGRYAVHGPHVLTAAWVRSASVSSV